MEAYQEKVGKNVLGNLEVKKKLTKYNTNMSCTTLPLTVALVYNVDHQSISIMNGVSS